MSTPLTHDNVLLRAPNHLLALIARKRDEDEGEEHPDAVDCTPDMNPQISALFLHEKQAKNRAKGPMGRKQTFAACCAFG
jgi:hypothetical protein